MARFVGWQTSSFCWPTDHATGTKLQKRNLLQQDLGEPAQMLDRQDLLVWL